MIKKNINLNNISSIEYDSNEKILKINFTTGEKYHHIGVPKNIYEDLINSNYIGYYIHYNIRNKYPYKKID
ncbi:KTSC domain-containing protein [Tepidibacter thalassicus]|uniref:KTSC domain-containing protein n=1 Tax=Tepidibacter thalassicus DSM 15285 TaxID=1123350 RepID=A0A1M5NYK1_9FIRM|nr:KTSC domain-containing protein [Tepidibacter thalassicus]SHG94568.1 KTSC domain-containing protein [Tepidibacter thalassicus DSM 15285]